MDLELEWVHRLKCLEKLPDLTDLKNYEKNLKVFDSPNDVEWKAKYMRLGNTQNQKST